MVATLVKVPVVKGPVVFGTVAETRREALGKLEIKVAVLLHREVIRDMEVGSGAGSESGSESESDSDSDSESDSESYVTAKDRPEEHEPDSVGPAEEC